MHEIRKTHEDIEVRQMTDSEIVEHIMRLRDLLTLNGVDEASITITHNDGLELYCSWEWKEGEDWTHGA